MLELVTFEGLPLAPGEKVWAKSKSVPEITWSALGELNPVITALSVSSVLERVPV
jgi:hypothetical protein